MDMCYDGELVFPSSYAVMNEEEIDDVKGKYLYLYNNVKHKYELVSTEDMSGLNLSTPGKYMITAKPIRDGNAAVRYILIAGGIGIIAGIVVYVAVKRRYWFW